MSRQSKPEEAVMAGDEGRVPDVSEQRAELPEDLVVRVCECGQIARGWAQTRCGENGVRNMRAECPTRRMRIVAWEDVDDV